MGGWYLEAEPDTEAQASGQAPLVDYEADIPGSSGSSVVDPGIDFFTTDEKLSGSIEGEHNPAEPGFPDDMGELQFVASGPPVLGWALRDTVKQVLQAQGYTWVEVASLETPVSQVAGIPVWGEYKVRAYFHGSPLLALPVGAFMWALLAAVSLIGVSIVVWQIVELIKQQEQTKRISLTKEIIDAMPESTPQQAAAKNEARQKAVTSITTPGGTLAPSGGGSSKGILDQFQDIGKVALWGGAIVLAFMALSTVKDITRK